MGWYDPPDDPPLPGFCEDECPYLNTEEEYKLDDCGCDPEKCVHLAVHVHYAICLKHKIGMWDGQCEYCCEESHAEQYKEAEEIEERYTTGNRGRLP